MNFSKNIILRVGFTLGMAVACTVSVQADNSPDPESGSSLPGVGNLIVYSATERSLAAATTDFDWEENRNLHTNYTIYGPTGSVFVKVTNSIGPYDERAKTVTLPAGKYTVRAMSPRDGWMVVPVIVHPGRLTVVKLADSVDAPRQEASDSSPIRNSHGNVVGWQSTNG